jgi:hypothetical protein
MKILIFVFICILLILFKIQSSEHFEFYKYIKMNKTSEKKSDKKKNEHKNLYNLKYFNDNDNNCYMPYLSISNSMYSWHPINNSSDTRISNKECNIARKKVIKLIKEKSVKYNDAKKYWLNDGYRKKCGDL